MKCLCGNLTDPKVAQILEVQHISEKMDYINPNKASKCFLAYNKKEKKWIKGCGFEQLNVMQKQQLEQIIIQNPEPAYSLL